MDADLLHKDVTDLIWKSAIEVHSTLGPGLLESAYEACLADELVRKTLDVQRQVSLPIDYKGRQLDFGYRVDLIVERSVIVELKCVEKIEPIHEAQLLTYLRLSGMQVGLLMNFNVSRIRDGVIRRVLTRARGNQSSSTSALSVTPR
jgi:GxxExxY protein